jgi:hypothetical protein
MAHIAQRHALRGLAARLRRPPIAAKGDAGPFHLPENDFTRSSIKSASTVRFSLRKTTA